MFTVKTLRHIFLYCFVQSFIPFLGPQLSPKTFKKLQMTYFPEKLL